MRNEPEGIENIPGLAPVCLERDTRLRIVERTQAVVTEHYRSLKALIEERTGEIIKRQDKTNGTLVDHERRLVDLEAREGKLDHLTKLMYGSVAIFGTTFVAIVVDLLKGN